MGSNMFCLKICDPSKSNPAGFCQHTLDEIGCAYNAPSKYTVEPIAGPGLFETCESDDMGIPGVYVQNGQTLSYAQPPGDGPIGQVPYTPTIPASSNCVTSASSALFTDAIGASTTGSIAATSGGSTASATSSAAAASQTSSATPSRLTSFYLLVAAASFATLIHLLAV
jgi:hypothetical protein